MAKTRQSTQADIFAAQAKRCSRRIQTAAITTRIEKSIQVLSAEMSVDIIGTIPPG
jgi:hypothetical protein